MRVKFYGLGLACILASVGSCVDTPTEPTAPPVIISRPASQNETVPENLNPGMVGWEMSYKVFPVDSLSVFASPYDVSRGDSVQVFIQSGFTSVKVQIYRIGWYDGTGARLMLSDSVTINGKQPPCSPAFPGPVTCPWTKNFGFTVGATWRGGLYLLKVISPTGAAAGYPFVVRSTGPVPDFLVVIPQFTWQAYNNYGGSSLYTKDPATGFTVPQVAFSRPYAMSLQRFNLAGSDVRSAVTWIEKSGLSVGYISDRDLADSTHDFTLPARGFIFAGHDEYWTWDEMTRVTEYRDARYHLFFMSGNTAFFNIRLNLDPGTGIADGLITCYKVAARDFGALNPTQQSIQFRQLGRPENALVGIMWQETRVNNGHPPDYLATPDSMRGPEATRFLTYAGLNTDDSLHVSLAGEGDKVINNGATPNGLQVLLYTPYADSLPTRNNASFYIARSGAGVFASGNNGWASFLDGRFASVNTQLITTSVVQWMLGN